MRWAADGARGTPCSWGAAWGCRCGKWGRWLVVQATGGAVELLCVAGDPSLPFRDFCPAARQQRGPRRQAARQQPAAAGRAGASTSCALAPTTCSLLTTSTTRWVW